jgi:hypothetical protein
MMNNEQSIQKKTLIFLEHKLKTIGAPLELIEEVKKYYISKNIEDPEFKEITFTLAYEIPYSHQSEIIENLYVPFVISSYLSENSEFTKYVKSEYLEEITISIPLLWLLFIGTVNALIITRGYYLSRGIEKLLNFIYKVVKGIEKRIKEYNAMKTFIENIPKTCIKEFIKEYDLVKDVVSDEELKDLIFKKFYSKVPLGKLYNYKELKNSNTIKCGIEVLASGAAVQLKTYLDCLSQTKSLDKLNNLINSPPDLLIIPDSPLITTLAKASPEVCRNFLKEFGDTIKLINTVVEKIYHNDVATKNTILENVSKKVEKVLRDYIKEYEKNQKKEKTTSDERRRK